jgi:ligand-binding SRPBCC domain-containing protein
MREGHAVVRQEALADGHFRLTTELFIARPRGEVFDFFSRAENLGRITPGWLDFRILTPLPLEMREGARIEYALRIRGVPVRWTTRISAWEPDVRFVDEQIRGPYRLWRHEHRFEDVPGGTICRDVVRFRVPGGKPVWWLFVRAQLDEIFSCRQERLKALLEGSGGACDGRKAARTPETVEI